MVFEFGPEFLVCLDLLALLSGLVFVVWWCLVLVCGFGVWCGSLAHFCGPDDGLIVAQSALLSRESGRFS